eukprot:4595006-Karenia_brevis.AAC.1
MPLPDVPIHPVRFDPYMLPRSTKRSASTGDSPKVNGIGGVATNNFGPVRSFRGVRHTGKQVPKPLEKSDPVPKIDMAMPPVFQTPTRQRSR